MNSEELLGMMKAQSEAYLTAYRTGYEKGFADAARQALEIVNKPKRNYVKQEKAV